jgi:hydrogenase maturation factor
MDELAGERCVTCGDVATPGRVVALCGGGMAQVESGGVIGEVAVDLVEARVGDVLLVHAGVAIGRLP